MMNIGIDLDGVLRDIHTALCIEWFLETGIHVTPSDFTEWGVHKFMGLDKVGWTEKQFYDWWFTNESIYIKSPVIQGSQEAVWELAKSHHLILVTSQPTPMARRRSMEFVHTHFPFPGLFGAMFFGHDKGLVRLDALIDDAVHNLERSSAVHKILFGQKWNENSRGFFRANDWKDVLKYI